MNDSYYALRPEASPVPVELLNRSQEKAMKAIVIALKEAITLAGNPKESNEQDGPLDLDRVSRLFFVSGQPGSGKSSLYLTLRTILSNRKLAEKAEKEYPGITPLANTTRWLEPIDLEVAGDKGENLLAAVLVRISDALGNSSEVVPNACQEAMTQLGDLANDIGIAWDGNLKARGGSLDPDSYSQEVMRAQRTRLHTNRRLRQALDKLSKEKCYRCTGETLFVLPIDDFYLKPAASLELLQLLRMISVPRLFFLIMGDIKTMEALFFEKALADWTAVAGPQVFTSLGGQRTQDVLSRVREMKARYLRKLLPAGQRAIIEWTCWDEALQHKPTVANSSGGAPELRTLLSGIRIFLEGKRSEDVSTNLLDYLVAPKMLSHANHKKLEVDPARLKRFQEAYSALLILDATPREVVDLWMCLNEFNRHGQIDDKNIPPDLYLWTVVDFALLAIEEQDFLAEKQQDRLQFAFPTSHKDDLLIMTDKFSLKQKVSPMQKKTASDFLVRKHLDWKLGIPIGESGESEEAGSVPRHLPPRAAAWIILLHDLVWNWQHERITQNLVHVLLDEIKKPCVSLTPKKDQPGMEDPGWAWYSHEGKWVHFPLLYCDTFRQLDRFLMVWNDAISSPNSNLFNLDTLVHWWGHAAWIAAGPEDRYDKFAYKLPTGEEENASLSNFKRDLFSDDPVLNPLATKVDQ